MSQNLVRVRSEIPPRRQIDCRWTRPSEALRLADYLCFLLYMFLVERWDFFWHSTELVIELICLHLYDKLHDVTPRRFIDLIYILCYSFTMKDQVLQAYNKVTVFFCRGLLFYVTTPIALHPEPFRVAAGSAALAAIPICLESWSR